MTTSAYTAGMRHWVIFLLLSIVILASAATAWIVWDQRANNHKLIKDTHQQVRLAISLQSQLANSELISNGTATSLKLKNTAENLLALATSNQHSIDKIKNPNLKATYSNPPFELKKRYRTLAGYVDSNPGLNNESLTLLRQTTDITFVQGLQNAAAQIEYELSSVDKWIVPGILVVLGALFFLLFTYHKWVFRALLARHNVSRAETRQAKNKLNVLALTDTLTGTANRKAITSFLSDFQNNHGNDSDFIALAILDIDHFQQINDVFGYFAGDEVLKEVATRISNELRTEDQLGRMNADHFAIVLSGLIAPKTAETIIHRIQDAITRPITFRDAEINVTCSIGAAVQEINSLDLAELFKLSEQALLQAKQNRRGSIFLFSENAQLALTRQREIINVIKESEFNDIFELAYQPIVALDNGKIVGCECLLRWTADTPANLQTAELVPTLEMYGDIHSVGNWVLRQGFQQLKKWQSQLPAGSLFISINVSATQLEADDFADSIVALAEEFGLPPGDISLELTETVAIKHLEAGRKQLSLLRNLGFGLSLDDFGTGYSSLQYLKNMPASTVKIDQAFIREMTNDPRDAAIVDSTINIARAVGLKVVAEGIDSHLQAQRLRDIGCHYGQGFYFFRPLSSSAFEQSILAQL